MATNKSVVARGEYVLTVEIRELTQQPETGPP
jgi:hypothetical protein